MQCNFKIFAGIVLILPGNGRDKGEDNGGDKLREGKGGEKKEGGTDQNLTPTTQMLPWCLALIIKNINFCRRKQDLLISTNWSVRS
jgi:hypothetical protein